MGRISIHPSARPAALSAALTAALGQGCIPGWYLYEGARQAALWLAYHQAYSPSRVDAKMIGCYESAFERALALLAAQPEMALELVSLGAGGGQKDAQLLRVAAARLPPAALCYFPLDSSVALVEEALGRIGGEHPLLPIFPLVANLGSLPTLANWLAAAPRNGVTTRAARRLFTCFGMVPNFLVESFLRYVADLLGAEDALLISANLSPRGMAADAPRILPQYDNPPARRWYAGALKALGLPSAGLHWQIAAQPLVSAGNRWQIQVQAAWRDRSWEDRSWRDEIAPETSALLPVLAAEKPLEVFFSNRFTRSAFETLLAEGGLQTLEAWLHPGEEEGIFLCRRV